MTIDDPTIRQSITIILNSTSTPCIDYARNNNTAIIIVDVTCIDVAHNNINIHRTDNTTTPDDNTCNNNAAVSIVVDVTCIDVSSTENTTTRDDNTFISSLIDVTWSILQHQYVSYRQCNYP